MIHDLDLQFPAGYGTILASMQKIMVKGQLVQQL